MKERIHKEILTFFEYLDILPGIDYEHDPDLDFHIVTIVIPPKQKKHIQQQESDILDHIHSLLKKIAHSKFEKDQQNIIFDLSGTQKKYIDELKQRALIAYERVITYKKPYQFTLLNPFERMVIHSSLKKFPDISTHSEGKGKERRLIISQY